VRHHVLMDARLPVEPMLATTADRPVDGPDWVFEPKLDGIRLLATREGDRVQLLTRNGKDHSDRYPELVDALAAQPHDRFVVDGEVVAFDGNLTSFGRLQQRSGLRGELARRSGVAVHLYLFDLLLLGDEDLRPLPLLERKARLHAGFVFDDPVRYSTHSTGSGPELLAHACAAGWEGLMAKRVDRPYRAGRSSAWLKLKCVADQELVIGGFTDPKGSRSRFGSLLVGHYDDSGLRFAGRVGTGFDQRTLDHVGDLLAAREQSDCPFVEPPTGRDLHWVRPDLVCQVGFTEWTASGRLRHPRFLGLREDKPASEVRRER
jgi:bifunctional non-homologous end joining protein LigD